VPRSRQLLCIVYGATAPLALIATWSQNLSYFRPEDGLVRGFVLATARFWPDTLTTPAGVSVTVDLGLFFLAAAVFMVLEARRLGVRFVWLYVILGFLVAISVTFPLFLIARERRLATQADVELAGGDRIGLWAFGAAMVLFSLWTLGR
jgi:hypothetical protein